MRDVTWSVPDVKRKKILSDLTGDGSGSVHPPAITGRGQGGKFLPDGTALPFPGNTFVCPIDVGSAFFAALCQVQDELMKAEWADHFSFLPKSSFHMTVFCGISGSPLGADGLPEAFDPRATLDDVTATFCDRLRKVTGEDGISMQAAGMDWPAAIEMIPASAGDADKLRHLRRKLQDVTRIFRPDFESYRFHVSLAYLTKWFAPDEVESVMAESERLFARFVSHVGPVALGPVELCEFETMHRFDRVGILDQRGFVDLSREKRGRTVD